MKFLISMLFLALTVMAPASHAADGDKLFINLTSDEPWRAGMALTFAKANLMRGYEVSVFLNVEGVRVAAKTLPHHRSGASGKTASEMVIEVLAAGGTVIVCPMCLKQAGLTPDDLVDGVTMGSPDVTFPALYDSDVQMSY